MLKIRPDIPIILCTGFNESITEDKAKALGIEGFAMKPFKPQGYRRAYRKALEKKGS